MWTTTTTGKWQFLLIAAVFVNVCVFSFSADLDQLTETSNNCDNTCKNFLTGNSNDEKRVNDQSICLKHCKGENVPKKSGDCLEHCKNLYGLMHQRYACNKGCNHAFTASAEPKQKNGFTFPLFNIFFGDGKPESPIQNHHAMESQTDDLFAPLDSFDSIFNHMNRQMENMMKNMFSFRPSNIFTSSVAKKGTPDSHLHKSADLSDFDDNKNMTTDTNKTSTWRIKLFFFPSVNHLFSRPLIPDVSQPIETHPKVIHSQKTADEDSKNHWVPVGSPMPSDLLIQDKPSDSADVWWKKGDDNVKQTSYVPDWLLSASQRFRTIFDNVPCWFIIASCVLLFLILVTWATYHVILDRKTDGAKNKKFSDELWFNGPKSADSAPIIYTMGPKECEAIMSAVDEQLITNSGTADDVIITRGGNGAATTVDEKKPSAVLKV